MTKFEIGRRYAHNGLLSLTLTVVARTAKTITFESDEGEVVKRRINADKTYYREAETVYLGGYYIDADANSCLI